MSESILNHCSWGNGTGCGRPPALGPILPGSVRVTSEVEKTVDRVTEGEVRSETA